MYKKRSLEGQKFGNLTVIKDLGYYKDNDSHFWSLVKCSCGKEFPVQDTYLVNMRKICCTNCSRKKRTTHSMTNSRIYHVYQSMKGRCYNPNNSEYDNYGGRGISVCNEWKNDASTFIKWAYENGYRDDADYMECTLDRKDVNGNYSPENCRWVDKLTQARNKRNTHYMTYKGERKSIQEVAKNEKISVATLKRRLMKGYSDNEAISLEVNGEYMRSRSLNHEIKRYAALIEKSTGKTKVFESCSEASRFLGFNSGYLSHAMGKRKSCKFEVKNYYVEIGEHHHKV